MRKLQAVPDTPPRAVLYLRQSVSRDDSISLELQEAAGRDYCQRMGYQVVCVDSDPGISGRTWKRPAVQRVMTMVEDGQADVIVLWKWSRLSRSRRDWAVAVDRIDVAGGRIESATESIDVATATGRLARGVLAEFAAFESDRIGEVWKEVHASRLAEGRSPTGKPKFGYTWNKEKKLHEPDPVTGPILAEAYERYVAGESCYSLVRWINAIGIKTTNEGAWTDHSLRRVMDAGFASGQMMWKGKLHPGIHTPLINPDLWQQYVDARETRRCIPARVKRSQYVLSGLVRCARCKGPMVANSGGQHRTTKFRCATSKERGPEACAGGYVSMRHVEEHVIAWLRETAESVDKAAKVAESSTVRRVTAEAESRRLSREVVQVDAAVTRLTVRLGEDLIPDQAYAAAVGELMVKRANLVARIDEHGRTARRVVENPAALAAGLLEDWEVLPVETRRTMLGRLIGRIEVTTTGHHRGVIGVQGGASTARVDIFEA